ncbi:DUF664 domain-containing protein [Streptomyces sp. ME18-1-4]|uniref:mycothiol transferase n=1 Tax=Streptomyces sp. ME18-1-4 TaxID=3028685 RepID=UPI0029A64020|nr:DUF664 domain-containing protein [Streptomyces sp. ME18-1-4]MDX3245420.1 DUF664 domain-containing protein [Streptomyces sp. ME18-1-4]
MTEPETGAILVIGGYGAVGAIVSRTLDGWFPGRVLAAGRRPQRARLAPSITAVRLDLREPGGLDELLRQYSISTVVLCVEPPDSALARTCLRQGIHFVDIGASDRLLRKVEAMADLAHDSGATAVLSVGVAPGLTNLLARQVHETLGGADRLDITVLLGAGEHHGLDAVGWTVGQLGRRYPYRAQPLRVALAGYNTRTAHPFGFSDQYSLRRTLGIGTVRTRLCLDSAPLTALLFGLQRIGTFRTETLRKALTQILARVHIGTSGFAIRVDGHHGDRHAASTLTGSEQTRITALVAAHVTRKVVTGTLPAGVHHIEQLPVLADIPSQLREHGTTLWPPEPRRPAPAPLGGSYSGPMLITAPVVDEDAVSTAGEREILETFLDHHREALRGKLRDLSERQVRQQLVPSPTTLIGLVKHAASVERNWFEHYLAQRPRDDIAGDSYGGPESWYVNDTETVADVVSEFDQACSESRRLAARFDLDHTVPHEKKGHVSLRWIYVHLIREHARHAGHADILRELTDGALGD